VRANGEPTYFGNDLAYHVDKLERGFGKLIDVWGADHHGYIPRMQAVMQAYGHPKERLRVVLVQMVNLMRAGRKVEMSKRAGEFVTMREVLDEVGADAAKFFFLMRRSDTHLDFDLELAKQRSADNPVYYVQYAHARLASLFRVAAERGIPLLTTAQADLAVLSDPEFELIRKLAAYPSVLQASAAALEPHRLTFYLQELAALLHTYYYKHRILPSIDERDGEESRDADSERFVPEAARSIRARETLTPASTAARLVLMRQVQQVLRNALGILGIAAPERM
jgi:arginyl-tRNA synthetase